MDPGLAEDSSQALFQQFQMATADAAAAVVAVALPLFPIRKMLFL